MKLTIVKELPPDAVAANYKGYEYYATPEGLIFTKHTATGLWVKKYQTRQSQTQTVNGAKKKYYYGHLFISLYKRENGKPIQTTVTVSKLVAHALLPNPNNFPFALHKDETLDVNGHLSNNVENLFWGNSKINAQDAKDKGRMKNNKGGGVLQKISHECKYCFKLFRSSNINRHQQACERHHV